MLLIRLVEEEDINVISPQPPKTSLESPQQIRAVVATPCICIAPQAGGPDPITNASAAGQAGHGESCRSLDQARLCTEHYVMPSRPESPPDNSLGEASGIAICRVY
jgi:hypothetical protein